jgi:hypothetical protein
VFLAALRPFPSSSTRRTGYSSTILRVPSEELPSTTTISSLSWVYSRLMRESKRSPMVLAEFLTGTMTEIEGGRSVSFSLMPSLQKWLYKKFAGPFTLFSFRILSILQTAPFLET